MDPETFPRGRGNFALHEGKSAKNMDDFYASLEGLSRLNLSTGVERAAAVRPTPQAQEVIVDGLNFLTFFCPSKEPGYAGVATPWELFVTTHMRVRAFLRGCKLANLKPTFVLGKSPPLPGPRSPAPHRHGAPLTWDWICRLRRGKRRGKAKVDGSKGRGGSLAEA